MNEKGLLRYTKNNFKEIGFEVMNYVYLAQGRDKWLAFVNMVMNLWLP